MVTTRNPNVTTFPSRECYLGMVGFGSKYTNKKAAISQQNGPFLAEMGENLEIR